MGATTDLVNQNARTVPPYRWLPFVIIPAGLLAIGLVLFVTLQPVQVLPRMELAPGYTLVDQHGNQVTSEDMRGQFTIYTFGYSGCLAPCVDPNLAMSEIQAALPAIDTKGVPVRLVTISFDAEHDGSEKLAAYAARLGADDSVWRFLTGGPARLKNAIGGGFGVYYQRNNDGSFIFDPMFVLVDGNGIVRARYRTATPEIETIARHLELAATEVQNSQGAGRLAYEAAHLFLCYAQ
jgi:protein SCO1/2